MKTPSEIFADVRGMQTGYYGKPGTSIVSNVHVFRNGKAICGAKFAASMEFQWCSNGIYRSYIGCDKCKNKADALFAAFDALEVRRANR